MDHTEIEERGVVDRYLMGKLPQVDTGRFEEHYLGCRQCLDQLELAERLQSAARTAGSEDVSRLAATRGLAVFAWLARRGPFLQLATMAVLVLLPATALLRQATVRPPQERSPGPVPGLPEGPPGGGHMEQRPGGEQTESFAPQAGTPIIPLRPQRGGPGAAAPSLQLELPPEPRWLVFSVELEPPYEASYRVVLHRGAAEEAVSHGAAGGEVWRAEALEPDFSGQLNVSFHSSFFEAGDYLLAVDAATPDGGSMLVGRHAFRVVGAHSPG